MSCWLGLGKYTAGSGMIGSSSASELETVSREAWISPSFTHSTPSHAQRQIFSRRRWTAKPTTAVGQYGTHDREDLEDLDGCRGITAAGFATSQGEESGPTNVGPRDHGIAAHIIFQNVGRHSYINCNGWYLVWKVGLLGRVCKLWLRLAIFRLCDSVPSKLERFSIVNSTFG